MQLHQVPHSVMFHHFHDGTHAPGQGSLSALQFAEMLDWLQQRYRILDAAEFKYAAINGKLNASDICISFDDALLCQFDIALPILNDYGIKAFFFIYSAPLSGEDNYLEIFRDFRHSSFSEIDEFYEEFFIMIREEIGEAYDRSKKLFSGSKYLADYPFYSLNDRWYRYLRDIVLGPNDYHDAMLRMLTRHDYDRSTAVSRLWMSENQVVSLQTQGHLVGMHSFSHPTAMSQMSRAEQAIDYSRNKEHLCRILGQERITAMSHPCGNYNEDTLSILQELKVEIGFNSNMAYVRNRGLLEIPREDQANILKQMTT